MQLVREASLLAGVLALLASPGCRESSSAGEADARADTEDVAATDVARDTRRDTTPIRRDTAPTSETGRDVRDDGSDADPSRDTGSLCENVELGANADLNGRNLFPADSYWNQPVENAAVDSNSDAIIQSIGPDTGLHADFGCCWMGTFGIPYIVVDGSAPDAAVSFRYSDESDPGPYPIPSDAPIEGGSNATGDRHVLALDCADRKLYELFDAHPQSDGSWMAGSGAIWDLDGSAVREPYCTSADAAGLPILPGLARYDEIEDGAIDHALRFTVETTRKAFVRPPASHWASSETATRYPPMGARFRLVDDSELKADGVDVSKFHRQVRIIVDALQKYGMILADNGSDWYISGAPHQSWKDGKLVNQLDQIKGRHFEVLEMKNVVDDRSVGPGSCQLD